MSKKGTNHETGKISCRGGVRDPLCRMRHGTRFRETANRAGPERCLQVRRCNVGTTRTAGTQASVRARTFLESSRGIEHGKRVTVSVQPFAWLLCSRQYSDFSCLLRPLLRERPRGFALRRRIRRNGPSSRDAGESTQPAQGPAEAAELRVRIHFVRQAVIGVMPSLDKSASNSVPRSIRSAKTSTVRFGGCLPTP